MGTYDFRTLNDKEFEEVVVDLLSAEEAKRIERFKPGKDGGIDGRWFLKGDDEAILQCKHYSVSGFPALYRSMKNSELSKIQKLAPKCYVLATSVPLSRANKDSLQKLLSPFSINVSDILGAEDLNQLLTKHPQIERAHYKLWLASSVVLQSMLNHPTIGRSVAELERLECKSIHNKKAIKTRSKLGSLGFSNLYFVSHRHFRIKPCSFD